MENNKYYTPSIEDLILGLNYERRGIKNGEKYWYPMKFGYEDIKVDTSIYPDFYKKDLKNMRIKFLDQEDIESLGWKSAGGYLDVKNFELSTGNTEKNTKENQWKLQLKTDNKIIIEQYRWIRFFGTIKNKSELKKLMQQLGINENQM